MLKFGRSRLQLIRYTTSAINNVDYLVNSLGFSKEQAILTSSKVSSFKYHQNPNSVVDFLKSNGFNQPQIRKAVSSYPKILSCKVDKTLKPKLQAFHDFGIHGSELADIISVHPRVFNCAVDKIVASLAVLKAVFGDDLMLLQALKKSSWTLVPNNHKTVPLNVALLKSYGFSPNQIKKMFLTKWRYFSLDPKILHCILIRVEEKIGIRRGSPMFFHGVCAFGGMTEESMKSKFVIFRSFGWSELDILTLGRKNPYSLASSELKIRTCLKFFMKELGHQPAEIAACTCAFTVSLEKRVIPRYEVLKVLKEKNLIKASYKIFSCLGKTELCFFNRFVLPFKDDLLDVYTDYVTRVGASVMTVP